MTTAADFDRQVKETRALLQQRNQPPYLLEEMVLDRLRAGIWTFDTSIMELVYAWRGYEKEHAHTLELIDLLFEFSEQRPMLRATLASIKGELLQEEGDTEGAVEAYLDAVDDLHSMHLNVDAKRIYSMVTLAHLLLARRDTQHAEKLFLDVLSYPWYLVDEGELRALLREYYVKAGIGLIACRRGNLAALQEIFFVPATHDVLMPTLQRAISEAQTRN